jgi:hypothetical protein
LLCVQRQDEYERARASTVRSEEEHLCANGALVRTLSKQLEKRRRLEEEALQKVSNLCCLKAVRNAPPGAWLSDLSGPGPLEAYSDIHN